MSHHVADAIDQIHAIARGSVRFYDFDPGSWLTADEQRQAFDDMEDTPGDDDYARAMYDPQWGWIEL